MTPKEPPLVRKQRAYRQLFLTPSLTLPEGPQKVVLGDLAKFCYANTPATKIDAQGRVDALATAQVIGRQEVWMRIQGMINLPIRDVVPLGFYGDQTDI